MTTRISPLSLDSRRVQSRRHGAADIQSVFVVSEKRGRRIGSALVEARSDRNAGRHIIHVGRDHDSHLIIPVLPAQD